MKLLSVIAILSTGLSLWAQTQNDWIFILRRDRVEVANPHLKTIVKSIELPDGEAKRIHPTPGGKFVFVTYEGRTDVTAIDAEKHEIAGSASFDFVPAYIQFSSMGEIAFITNSQNNEVRVYNHRRAEFTYVKSVFVGTAGTPVMTNRRATRLYRASSEGLDYVYLKTGEIMEVVKVRGGLATISISPDFRTFWAIDRQNGYISIIDEARARVSRQVKVSHDLHHPLFAGSTVALLSKDGESLRLYNERNYREQATIDLENSAEGVIITEKNQTWSRSNTGIEITDLETGVHQSTITVSDSIDLIYVVVRSGEGYACF